MSAGDDGKGFNSLRALFGRPTSTTLLRGAEIHLLEIATRLRSLIATMDDIAAGVIVIPESDFASTVALLGGYASTEVEALASTLSDLRQVRQRLEAEAKRQ